MSTGVWAVLAVKQFAESKSRLAPALTPGERERLSRQLFARTLAIVTGSPLLEGVVVVSDGDQALRAAAASGAQALPEPGGGLNSALEAGRLVSIARGARSVLFIHADLPLLAADDLTALIGDLPGDPGVVLAPDRHESGTNAMLERPAGAMALHFGPDSLRRHKQAARERGLKVTLLCKPGLALDIDTPDDLEALPHGLLESLILPVVSVS